MYGMPGNGTPNKIYLVQKMDLKLGGCIEVLLQNMAKSVKIMT